MDHASIAFSASWHESKLECGESWAVRKEVGPSAISQKKGSFEKDEQVLKRMSEAPNARERQLAPPLAIMLECSAAPGRKIP